MLTQTVSKTQLNRFTIVLLSIICIPFCGSYAQNMIKGRIVLAKDERAAAYASVRLLNRSDGKVSDTAGNFSLAVHNLKQNDTLLISLIGYDNLKIAAKKALQQSTFVLQQSQSTLETVVVRSFSKEEIAGAKSEIVGYFRSWNAKNTSGEIGRSFLTAHKEYQVAKVRFKVYNTYDTCLIRLHIREMKNGEPGRELLRDSIAQVINRSDAGDKAYEFDLNKYNVILTHPDIFVSFQVLNGGKKDNSTRSLSFIGSEAGSYLYRSMDDDTWHSSDDYTIYMKLLLKYDD